MVLTSSDGSKIIYPNQKIEPIQQAKKIKGTLTTFAKAGGCTLLSAFIPILHFVLVPVGLIITATMSYNAYKRKYELKDFEIHCPHCDKKSQMSIVGKELPLRTFCSHCRNMVYLDN
jgi:phage terminase large subunit GpA-like protein